MNKEEGKGRNVFANRNFRLVFFGALVSELGALLYSFAVSFYLLEISDNNAFLQGLYLALCAAAMLVFTPAGGVIGDRYNKAGIMYVCDYLRGAGILIATFLMLVFQDPQVHIVILFAVGILGNVIGGIFSPAAGALFPHIVEEDRLQQANSYFSAKSSLQNIVGVLLAGVLYAALQITTLFFLVGICYVLSGLSEMFIRYDFRPSEEKLTVRLAFADMKDGLNYLKEKKALVTLLVSFLFINFFFSPIGGNFIPYFVKTDVAEAPSYLFDSLLTPELWSSVISMLIGISSLIGAAVLSARTQKEKVGRDIAKNIGIIAVVMLMLSVSYWLLADKGYSLNTFLIILCIGSLILGYVVVGINVPLSTTLMRVVERDKLSKVSSLISILSQGIVPLAHVLAGAVLQGLGSTAMLFMCTAGFLVTTFFMLFNKRTKDI